jgi:hypothetical protein
LMNIIAFFMTSLNQPPSLRHLYLLIFGPFPNHSSHKRIVMSLNQAVTEGWGLTCTTLGVHPKPLSSLYPTSGRSRTHMHVLQQLHQHRCCCKIRGKKMQRACSELSYLPPPTPHPTPPHPTPEKEIYFRRSYCKVHELLLGSFNTQNDIIFQKCLQFSPRKALIFSLYFKFLWRKLKKL